MEPVSIVVTALIAGAAAGISGAATDAVTKVYESLRMLVIRGISMEGTTDPDQLLTQGVDLGVGTRALTAELTRAGVDDATIGAARLVFAALLEEARTAKFAVSAPDAKGLMIGDNNTQHNSFS